MASERKQMRVLIRTWLKSITALTDIVGAGDNARIYAGWPTTVPSFPLITFATGAHPVTDYPYPAYSGELVLSLYSPDIDDLDDMEDAIMEWFEVSSNNIIDDLTDEAVSCLHMSGPPEVPLDEYITGQHEMELITAVRTLHFEPFAFRAEVS